MARKKITQKDFKYQQVKEIKILNLLNNLSNPKGNELDFYNIEKINGHLDLNLRDKQDYTLDSNTIYNILSEKVEQGLLLKSINYGVKDIESMGYRINPAKISKVEQILHDNAKLLAEY